MSHYIRISTRILLAAAIKLLQSCTSSSGNEGFVPPPAEMLPVVAVASMPATTYQEFSASIEGSMDIEIRPQVMGYIEKIYVDEGAYVKKGAPMFKINDRPFIEQLNNARASRAAAEASVATAKINVDKLTPLVQHAVISEVQLKTAQAAYDAAKANLQQTSAMVTQAQINLGYTTIKAPVSGYIGRIPHKIGSLVSTSTAEPLTLLSEMNKMYAYFSLSEADFISFKQNSPGKTVDEKIKNLPPVELVLPDNTIHPHKGKIESVSGQFNNTMGSITFRAAFPNDGALLRSGSTGRIRIPRNLDSAVIIPQVATFELQDRTLVFIVEDSNKVSSVPISIAGKSGNYYLVKDGVSPGQRIVYSGLDRLQDGTTIRPQPINMDSLLKADPM